MLCLTLGPMLPLGESLAALWRLSFLQVRVANYNFIYTSPFFLVCQHTNIFPEVSLDFALQQWVNAYSVPQTLALKKLRNRRKNVFLVSLYTSPHVSTVFITELWGNSYSIT